MLPLIDMCNHDSNDTTCRLRVRLTPSGQPRYIFCLVALFCWPGPQMFGYCLLNHKAPTLNRIIICALIFIMSHPEHTCVVWYSMQASLLWPVLGLHEQQANTK